MNQKLQEVLKKSTLEIIEGRYIYAKVKSLPAKIENHFMVSVDRDEITVVTREENLGDLDLVEKNKDHWKLIALDPVVSFYIVGQLAAWSGAIAQNDINTLIVSTYSKDYFLVCDIDLDRAVKALISLGVRQIGNLEG